MRIRWVSIDAPEGSVMLQRSKDGWFFIYWRNDENVLQCQLPECSLKSARRHVKNMLAAYLQVAQEGGKQ